jgi:hypothetical protein
VNTRRIRPLPVVLVAVASVATAIGCRKRAVEERYDHPLSRYDCAILITHAAANLAAASRAANPTGQVSCANDDDCAEVEPPACMKVCGGHGVPKRATAPFVAAMRAIEESDCRQWEAGACATVAPRPVEACPNYVLRCHAGACKVMHSSDLQ